MSILKVGAVVIMIGSLLFMMAALSPISRIFGLPSPEERWKIISKSSNAWVISQVLFAAGSVITPVGIILVAAGLHGRPGVAWIYIAIVFLCIGALAWSWHVYSRAQHPKAFVDGALPGWYSALYSLLTMAALALVGISLLIMGFPAWLPWLLIGGSSLLLVLYLVFRDMPPVVYYILWMILGVILYRTP